MFCIQETEHADPFKDRDPLEAGSESDEEPAPKRHKSYDTSTLNLKVYQIPAYGSSKNLMYPTSPPLPKFVNNPLNLANPLALANNIQANNVVKSLHSRYSLPAKLTITPVQTAQKTCENSEVVRYKKNGEVAKKRGPPKGYKRKPKADLSQSFSNGVLQLPKALQPMKYQVQYRAPSPPPPGVTRTPEEIEAEMKKVEAQYEKLAHVSIELPQDVMWSEPPVICQWQDARKLWTSNYVNDYKFNEDKLSVQFRTGVLWPIGIAALRYSNMPYQTWDMRPDPDGKGVMLTVTGLCVTITWACVGNSVRLRWIANATTPALKEHFNKPYSVKRMLQIMREAACDFFPDFDGHNHVEGSCPKEWVMERHNYHAMAFLSRAYNFQWSRWNVGAGSRTIIMQIREAVDKKREAKSQLLYVTPRRATILKANELTQEISLDPMVGLEFYPDLFTLNMSYGSVDARRTTFNMKNKLVETVFDLLQELKLSSYS